MSDQDTIEELRVQTKGARFHRLIAQRLSHGAEFASRIEAIFTSKDPDPNAAVELLDKEVARASHFLQEFCHLAGRPFVLACRSDMGDEETKLGDENVLKVDTVTGVTIVTPCNGEQALELLQAFENVMQGEDEDLDSF